MSASEYTRLAKRLAYDAEERLNDPGRAPESAVTLALLALTYALLASLVEVPS